MTRKTIAIDIDDVLSTHAEDFVRFSNNRWGTSLTIDDYDENWQEMWGVSREELISRSEELHASGVVSTYGHRAEAIGALRKLKKHYHLVIVTSRRRVIMNETAAWIDSYFKGLFEEIHYAGMWDNHDKDAHNMTKADICAQIGADYLIDDQLKHCRAAAESGIESLVFGDYAWNHQTELPHGVTRVKSWQEVEEYFGVT